MDAVEFVKMLGRMCNAECTKCEFWRRRSGLESCAVWQKTHPEETVAIIEQWVKEHPSRTRQSEFLKIFPHAMVYKDCIDFCPNKMDQTYTPDKGCTHTNCIDCKKEFWLAEVKE